MDVEPRAVEMRDGAKGNVEGRGSKKEALRKDR